MKETIAKSKAKLKLLIINDGTEMREYLDIFLKPYVNLNMFYFFIKDANFSLKQTEALTARTEGFSGLSMLSVEGNKFSDTGKANLASIIERNPKLRFVGIKNVGLDPAQGDAASVGLAKPRGIETAWLSGNDFGAKGKANIAKMIENNPELNYVDIKNIGMDAAEGDAVAQALAGLSRLAYVTLSGNDFGAKGKASIVAMIKNNPGLGTIDIEGVDLGADLWDGAAEAMATLKFLTKIRFSGKNFGDKGKNAVANIIKNNPGLEAVDIRDIGMDKTQGDAAAQALAGLTGLERVQLSGNDYGDKGKSSVATIIKNNPGLEVVDIRDIGMGKAQADAAAQALARMKGLLALSLSGNDYGDKGKSSMAGIVKNNPGLQFFDITGVGMDEVQGDAAAEALAGSRNLIWCVTLGNSFSPGGMDLLVDAFCNNPVIFVFLKGLIAAQTDRLLEAYANRDGLGVFYLQDCEFSDSGKIRLLGLHDRNARTLQFFAPHATQMVRRSLDEARRTSSDKYDELLRMMSDLQKENATLKKDNIFLIKENAERKKENVSESQARIEGDRRLDAKIDDVCNDVMQYVNALKIDQKEFKKTLEKLLDDPDVLCKGKMESVAESLRQQYASDPLLADRMVKIYRMGYRCFVGVFRAACDAGIIYSLEKKSSYVDFIDFVNTNINRWGLFKFEADFGFSLGDKDPRNWSENNKKGFSAIAKVFDVGLKFSEILIENLFVFDEGPDVRQQYERLRGLRGVAPDDMSELPLPLNELFIYMALSLPLAMREIGGMDVADFNQSGDAAGSYVKDAHEKIKQGEVPRESALYTAVYMINALHRDRSAPPKIYGSGILPAQITQETVRLAVGLMPPEDQTQIAVEAGMAGVYLNAIMRDGQAGFSAAGKARGAASAASGAAGKFWKGFAFRSGGA